MTQVQGTRFCPQCGAQLLQGAAFCSQCGSGSGSVGNNSTNYGTYNSSGTSAGFNDPYIPVGSTPPNAGGLINSALSPASSMRAPAASGEIDVDVPRLSGNTNRVGGALKQAEEILSPSGAIFMGISRFFSGIGNAFKSPKALLSAIIMFAAWFYVSYSESKGQSTRLTEIISKVTYAGGLKRGGLGAFSGIFGMGTVAAAFCTLFYGGIPKLFKGAGKIFSGGFSLGSLMTGLGFSTLCLKLFTGGSSEGLPVAVSGLILSLQAAGLSGGYLHSISAAYARVKNTMGEYTVKTSRYTNFFGGMAAGFTAGAALSFNYSYSYLIPIALIVLGRIINAIFKPKAVSA